MDTIIGSMTALVTPFKNGKLDLEKYETLIKRQIANGVDAVSPVGTTGESATLSHKEHKECIEVAVATCKNTRVKVLAGAGSNATSEACDIAKFAQEIGANGILSIAPYYNKPTQEGLYQHYKTIAQSVEIPFMLYNVPGRTGVDLLPETAIRLFDDVKNIYGIKEATGSLERATAIISQRENFFVFSGDDSVDFAMLASGAKGIISVTSNLVPNLKSKLVSSVMSGDFQTALKIHNDIFELNKVLFCAKTTLFLIKAAMYLSGLLDSLEFRLPLTNPSNETLEQIRKNL